MNEDIARLRTWMEENNLDLAGLARKMGVPYITAHTVIERRASTTDQFVNRFIRCFGYDVAQEIFRDHLAPVAVSEATQ